jgi:hypothetical protein
MKFNLVEWIISLIQVSNITIPENQQLNTLTQTCQSVDFATNQWDCDLKINKTCSELYFILERNANNNFAQYVQLLESIKELKLIFFLMLLVYTIVAFGFIIYILYLSPKLKTEKQKQIEKKEGEEEKEEEEEAGNIN